MADYKATDTEFTAVANAIRTKGGTSSQLVWPNGFVSAVNAIPTGGGGGIIDYSYLPNSVQADVLASADYTLFDGQTVGTLQSMVAGDSIISSQDGLAVPLKACLGYNLGTAKDVTVYFCGKKTSSGQFIISAVESSYSGGNCPGLWSPDGNSNMSLNVYNSSATLGVSSVDFNVYAFSINLTSKKTRGYANGVYITELNFNNSGQYVSFGNTPFEAGGLTGTTLFKYGGIVNGVESDATIIANMQTIMQKLGIT